MDEQILEYPSHTLRIQKVGDTGFIKAINIVNGDVYQNMVDVAIGRSFGSNFVYEERLLLANFVKSLVSFNNENLLFGTPVMTSFVDEADYYVFCLINEVPFEEQAWFKTIYVKTSFLNSITLFKSASVRLLKMLYPSLYVKPKDLLAELFTKYEEEKEKYKIDLTEVQRFLDSNDIHQLYHFSGKKNLDSIKARGLLSINRLMELGIKVEYSSSQESRQIDYRKGYVDYVHLSYEINNPMLYIALSEGRISDYSLFCISPDVLFLKETKYSIGNAASGNATISSDLKVLYQTPFSSFHNKQYYSLGEQDKFYFQSEVLVKSHIPITNILNLNSL